MKQNKKIIHAVVKYFYPVAAGIETNMLETYSVLAQRGWDVTIHTSKDTHVEKNVLKDTEAVRGLKVIRYQYHWYSFWPKIDWDQADLICLHNFDVVPQLYVMLYALWRKITREKTVKIALTPHGGFTPDWNVFSKATALVKKTYHYSLGALLINNSVDSVRAVSDWERNEIIKHGIPLGKVVTIKNGIENEAYLNVDRLATKGMKVKVQHFGKYIIQIGRIYPIKNYETSLRAFSKLPKGVNFVIMGPIADEKYYESLKELIKKLGIEKRVLFVGVIRGVDKYFLIKHAQMMVHTARWESFCNVVHEGMSQGLVCVVANNTALVQLVKPNVNGYLVDTNNASEFYKKIHYVLLNKNKHIAMSQTNKSFALEHSWKKVAINVDKIYHNLIKDINYTENISY